MAFEYLLEFGENSFFLKSNYSKKPAKKIFTAVAGKLNLNFITKNSNLFSSHGSKDFFGGFLRKIRLYRAENFLKI